MTDLFPSLRAVPPTVRRPSNGRMKSVERGVVDGMITLHLRYTIDPNKASDFSAYIAAEQIPIRESGGTIVGYFAPTDFAGTTSEGFGLIDFASLAAYERYRAELSEHPLHKRNIALLVSSGAVRSIERSLLQRVPPSDEAPSS